MAKKLFTFLLWYSTYPPVALDCAIKPLNQRKTGVDRTNLYATESFNVERASNSHGNRPLMDSFILA